jgi:hypothetical protein
MNRIIGSIMVVVLLCIAAVIYWESPPHPTVNTSGSAEINSAKLIPELQRGDGPNLLASFQDFTNPAWVHDGITLTPNAAASPDGTTDAARMTETGGDGFHRLALVVPGVKAAGVFTLSIFVKPAERHSLQFEMTEAEGHYGLAQFDLAKKRVTSEARDVQDAGLQELPDGWFRCWAVMPYKTPLPAFDIAFLNDTSLVEYKGSDEQGFLIWGPQFEAANEVRGYSTK